MSEPTTPPQDTANVVALPPLIYLGPLTLGLVLNAVWPRPLLPQRATRIMGLTVTAGALSVGGAAFAALRRAGTPPDPGQPITAIVARGLYRFSRNPIYLAFTLLYAGLALVANALWPLALLPGVLVVMRRGVIDREERYLDQRFGDEYRAYTARVRRWL